MKKLCTNLQSIKMIWELNE